MADIVDLIFVASEASSRDIIQVYDALTGSALHSYKGFIAAPQTLSLTGPDTLLLCGSKDRSLLQAWRINKREGVSQRLNVPGRVGAVAVSPTSPTTVVASVREIIYVYNLESGAKLSVISRHFQTVTSLAFSPCGNFFFSGGEDGFVYMWRIQDVLEASYEGSNEVRPFKQLTQHSDKVNQVVVTGGRVVSVSNDHTARVFCFLSLNLLHTVVLGSPITCGALTCESTRLVLGTESGHVTVVDLFPVVMQETIRVLEEERPACHTGPVASVIIYKFGSSVVTAGAEDGEVKIWQVKDESASQPIQITQDKHSLSGSKKSLVWKRTIHRGKGGITNILHRNLFRKHLLDTSVLTEPIISDLKQAANNTDDSITVYPGFCSTDHIDSKVYDEFRYTNDYEEKATMEYLLKNIT